MNPLTFSNIAIKLLAIFIIFRSFSHLAQAVTFFVGPSIPSDIPSKFLILMVILAPLFAGILLWFSANKLSRFIMKGNETSNPTPISIKHLQVGLLSAAGLIILMISIPDFIQTIIVLFGDMNLVNDERVFHISHIAYLISETLRIIFGISLILGTSGWVKILDKFQSFGLKNKIKQ